MTHNTPTVCTASAPTQRPGVRPLRSTLTCLPLIFFLTHNTPTMCTAAAPTQRPGVRSLRSTLTSLPLIVAPAEGQRRTKIICTMGPACWGEEKLGQVRVARTSGAGV